MNSGLEEIQRELGYIKTNEPFRQWLIQYFSGHDNHRDKIEPENIFVEKSGLSPNWYSVEIHELNFNTSNLRKITRLLDSVLGNLSPVTWQGKKTSGISFTVYIGMVDSLLQKDPIQVAREVLKN